MKRADLIAALRVAGYHNDSQAFTRLFLENRIARPVADGAFERGREQKRQGMACACYSCKEAFHAHIRRMDRLLNAGCLTEFDGKSTRWTVAGRLVGISIGPVGASTGYKIIEVVL